jgi:ubiquinone biosynthesis protein
MIRKYSVDMLNSVTTRARTEERPPSERIQTAVADGLRRWPATEADGERPSSSDNQRLATALRRFFPTAPENDDQPDEVVSSMPRRRRVIAPPTADTMTPILASVTFKTSFWRAWSRLFAWIYLVLYVLGGNLWDRLRGKDGIERRAARLRRGLEKIGGTFVKLGQQVAMRIDLAPWEYCVELSKMLDRMPPFSQEEAIAAIERTTGKPWHETFAVFDPKPIGSASIACVYQAVLKDGTRVAVKIRRPGIGELFMADFRVLDWILDLIEFLTIIRPGFTRNLRREFRATLLEELDFTREARFQAIFRRNAREQAKKKFFTAPKVYFELSNEEMIVQEYVSGMWLWEVIAAIEQNDPQGLAMMQRLNIDPKRVARRILWVTFWSMDENLFFHADPHPANILIGRDSTLTFIDFGSCGSFNDEQRAAMERTVVSMQNGDAEGMARATLKLLEPLPPVDVAALMKEAEGEYMRVLYTFGTKAKYTEWWERTSARQWLALVKVAQQYNLPLNLHTLRMIRATLLYDTLVLRLDRKIDRYEEYGRFMNYRAGLAKKRLQKRWQRSMEDGLFMSLHELAETGEDVVLRIQHTLSSPFLNFGAVIDKWIFTFSVLGRMVGRVALVAGIAVLLVSLAHYFRDGAVDLANVLDILLHSSLFYLALLSVVVLNVRLILFRLRERDAD